MKTLLFSFFMLITSLMFGQTNISWTHENYYATEHTSTIKAARNNNRYILQNLNNLGKRLKDNSQDQLALLAKSCINRINYYLELERQNQPVNQQLLEILVQDQLTVLAFFAEIKENPFGITHNNTKKTFVVAQN